MQGSDLHDFVKKIVVILRAETKLRTIIVGSIRIFKGMELSAEQIRRLDALADMSDDEIDYSDIPKIPKEELARFKPARLREKNRHDVVD